MFIGKFIKNRKRKKEDGRYRIYKVFSSEESTKTIKIVSKKKNLTAEQFDEIFHIIRSDLRTEDFNYKGRTKLELQLLLDISNGKRIELQELKSGAVVIIH